MQPRILVGFDFGPACAKALSWAKDLRATAGGPPVHVLHVVPPIPAVAPPEIVPTLTQEDLARLADSLARHVREIDPAATTEVIVERTPGEAIIATAKRLGADLIVMGTHGRHGLSRMVLGSVAEYVVRHAACPVVTVRSPA